MAPELEERLTESWYRFWIEDRVRFADLDPLGHCNNAAVSGFFESSRVALMTAVCGALEQTRIPFPIVRQLIEFRSELLYGTPLRIGARVIRIGRTSLLMHHGVFAGDRCAATAEITGVRIDLGTRRPVPWPADIRAALAAYGDAS